jgi:hypothetical protein
VWRWGVGGAAAVGSHNLCGAVFVVRCLSSCAASALLPSVWRGVFRCNRCLSSCAASTLLPSVWRVSMYQVSQQLCGINAVFYYSTMFFKGLISNPLTGTTLVATVNVIATVTNGLG